MTFAKEIQLQRYGPYNIIMEPNYNLKPIDVRTIKRMKQLDIYNQVKSIYTIHTKGRRAKDTTDLASLYFTNLNQSTLTKGRQSSSWTTLVNQQYSRFIYFLENQHQYYNDFPVFSPSFYTSILFGMRYYNLNLLARQGKCSYFKDRNCHASIQFYPLPKSVPNKLSIELAEKLFDIYDSI